MQSVTTREKKRHHPMTIRDMFSLWWNTKWIRTFVILIAPIGLVDTIVTLILYHTQGAHYEYNPLVKIALSGGHEVLWSIINSVSFVLFAMIVGSYYLFARDHAINPHSKIFGGLISLRISIIAYNLMILFNVMEYIIVVFFLGAVLFIFFESLLSRTTDASIEGFKTWWRWRYYKFRDWLILRRTSLAELEKEEQPVIEEPIEEEPIHYDMRKVWARRIVLFALAFGAFIFIPNLTATVASYFGKLYGGSFLGNQLYWTIETGRVFVVGFIVIIFMIGVVIYILLQAFENTNEF